MTLIQAGVPSAQRVTPVRSFYYGEYDPTPTTWQTATGAGDFQRTVTPPSEPDQLALRVEAEGIWHRLESDRLNRARADALEAQVIETCGGLVAYHRATERASRADRSGVDLPDPSKVPAVARLQGRTLRVSGKTSPADAAEIRKAQLLRRRREQASGLLASGRLSYADWAAGRGTGTGTCSCACHGGR